MLTCPKKKETESAAKIIRENEIYTFGENGINDSYKRSLFGVYW